MDPPPKKHYWFFFWHYVPYPAFMSFTHTMYHKLMLLWVRHEHAEGDRTSLLQWHDTWGCITECKTQIRKDLYDAPTILIWRKSINIAHVISIDWNIDVKFELLVSHSHEIYIILFMSFILFTISKSFLLNVIWIYPLSSRWAYHHVN